MLIEKQVLHVVRAVICTGMGAAAYTRGLAIVWEALGSVRVL